MIQREEIIGDCRLILGDCREVIAGLTFDAICTDPPYGINYRSTLHGLGAAKFEEIANDDGKLDLRPILSSPCAVIAFGANNFPDQLPHRGRWLCWDKRTIDGAADAMLGSPFELAWINKTSGYDKIFRLLHGGVVNADGGKRVHPTQKPVALMEWCLGFLPDAKTILDPFMGSGTTLVACAKLGRKGIGIELDPEYFDIACRRVEQAYRQPDLFIPKPTPPKQEQLL